MATSRVKDDVQRLTALVEAQGRVLEEQSRRLEQLEQRRQIDHGRANGNGNGESRHSRRDLLRLAGLAAAGAASAAGATALTAVPAAAGSGVGATFQLGQSNDTDVTTTLVPTTTTPAGSAVASGIGASAVEIDSSKAGAVTASATYFRAVHGISPNSSTTISGVGLWGSSLDGAGVIGSSKTGVDLWAFNTGRLMQSTQPAGQPTYEGGVYDPTVVPPATTPNGWTDLEIIRDINGVVWVYIPPSQNGNPVAYDPNTAAGTWFPVLLGGLGVSSVGNNPDSTGSIFSAVSNSLMALHGSDGVTFKDMMVDTAYVTPTPPQLVLTITPAFDCQALITGSGDFYTDTANAKQDVGIYVSPSDPHNLPNNTQHIEAWKENGAGTVQQPNAAFVQTLFKMVRGTTYTVKLMWKINTSSGATIRCGAGPFGNSNSLATNCSPTRLTVLLLSAP